MHRWRWPKRSGLGAGVLAVLAVLCLSTPASADVGPHEDLKAAQAELDASTAKVDALIEEWELTIATYRRRSQGKSGAELADAETDRVGGCRLAIKELTELGNAILTAKNELLQASITIQKAGEPDPLGESSPDTKGHLAKLDAAKTKYAEEGMRAGLVAIRGTPDDSGRGTAEVLTLSIAKVDFGAPQALREEVMTEIIRHNLARQRWFDTKGAAQDCVEECRGDEPLALAHYALARAQREDEKDDKAAGASFLAAMAIVTRGGRDVDPKLQGDIVGGYIAIIPSLDTPTLSGMLESSPDVAEIRDPIERELATRDDYTPPAEPAPAPANDGSPSNDSGPSSDYDPPKKTWQPRVKRYWRSPPKKPAVWLVGGYSAPLTTQRFEGAQMRQRTGFDIGIDALTHPRLTLGLWYSFNGWKTDEHPELESARVNRLEVRFASDLIALPRQWPLRASLSPVLGLGLGWMREDTVTTGRDSVLGVGLTVGGEGALHINIKNFLLKPYAGITKPIYAMANTNISDGYDKGFPRAWRWHAGLGIGFAPD